MLSTGPAADLGAAEWQKVSAVNLSGVLYCTQASIPVMRRQRYGRIINIASVAAMRGGGTVGNALYGATKAGVVALTMGFARELGPDGITVNAIAPAIADTAMTRAALTDKIRRKSGANSRRAADYSRRYCRSGCLYRLCTRKLHHRDCHSCGRRHSNHIVRRRSLRRCPLLLPEIRFEHAKRMAESLARGLSVLDGSLC